ncbi:MAG: UDP-N-acetylmuramate dehydrogenase [Oscillospiraceae bacterium]
MTNLYSYFKDVDAEILKNELLKKHSNFQIGGKCSLMVIPKNKKAIIDTFKIVVSKSLKFFILGKGANVLFLDEGYDGVVIKLSSKYSNVYVDKNDVICDAGVTIAKLCTIALKNNLSGLEFAFGIPGTLGGAVYMNAGAYGGEFKDIIKDVTYIEATGEITTKNVDDLDFEYRHSFFSNKNLCILSATLRLKEDSANNIKQKMDELLEKRVSKQPYFKPSAGSTFKRPQGNYASYLIEQCGLKGFKIGGAMVSEKHSGFVINDDGATSEDVLNLINHIKKDVFEKTGYFLECEVQIIK